MSTNQIIFEKDQQIKNIQITFSQNEQSSL